MLYPAMNELLKKYNIEVDSALTYCTVPSNLQNCYANVMSKEIDKRYQAFKAFAMTANVCKYETVGN